MKLKKITVLKKEAQQYENCSIGMGLEIIDGVQHLRLNCPKCNTQFAIPVDTLKMFFIVKEKKRDGVVV